MVLIPGTSRYRGLIVWLQSTTLKSRFLKIKLHISFRKKRFRIAFVNDTISICDEFKHKPTHRLCHRRVHNS